MGISAEESVKKISTLQNSNPNTSRVWARARVPGGGPAWWGAGKKLIKHAVLREAICKCWSARLNSGGAAHAAGRVGDRLGPGIAGAAAVQRRHRDLSQTRQG